MSYGWGSELEMNDYASPDDMKRAPLWHNYVMAQTSYASLGRIPRSAWRIGVRIDREHITLVVDWSEPDEGDREDLDDLVSELDGLFGMDVELDVETHVTELGSAPHRPGVDHTYIDRRVFS